MPALVMFALTLLLCPLLPGIINRVKAKMAGRNGPPLVQLYYDIAKLLRKDFVYSETATWVFRACPTAVLGCAVAAALLTPLGGGGAVLAFSGDFLVWAGAFTLARIVMILAGLDVGSSFESMGGSREAWYAVLAEPALFLAMATLAVISGDLSLSGFFLSLTPETTAKHLMAMLFAGVGLLLVAITENARIPVDDPTTHLELTMIHEVMILDHSGPDLALIEYGSALKLWLMGALAVGTVVPVHMYAPWLDAALFVAGMIVFALIIGLIESCMARLRLVRVPQFLVGATVLSAIALLLVARNP